MGFGGITCRNCGEWFGVMTAESEARNRAAGAGGGFCSAVCRADYARRKNQQESLQQLQKDEQQRQFAAIAQEEAHAQYMARLQQIWSGDPLNRLRSSRADSTGGYELIPLIQTVGFWVTGHEILHIETSDTWFNGLVPIDSVASFRKKYSIPEDLPILGAANFSTKLVVAGYYMFFVDASNTARAVPLKAVADLSVQRPKSGWFKTVINFGATSFTLANDEIGHFMMFVDLLTVNLRNAPQRTPASPLAHSGRSSYPTRSIPPPLPAARSGGESTNDGTLAPPIGTDIVPDGGEFKTLPNSSLGQVFIGVCMLVVGVPATLFLLVLLLAGLYNLQDKNLEGAGHDPFWFATMGFFGLLLLLSLWLSRTGLRKLTPTQR